jgi:Lar family restriction alleviation protein
MESSESERLEPCPFCGSEDVKVVTQNGVDAVECGDCCIEGPPGESYQEAVTLWNTRANAPAPDAWEAVEAIIEPLRGALRGDTRYLTTEGFTKWGLVEQDILATLSRALRPNESDSDVPTFEAQHRYKCPFNYGDEYKEHCLHPLKVDDLCSCEHAYQPPSYCPGSVVVVLPLPPKP